MPIVSKAQGRWMWATHPAMARRWEEHTPSRANLPEHVGDSKKRKRKKKAEVEQYIDNLLGVPENDVSTVYIANLIHCKQARQAVMGSNLAPHFQPNQLPSTVSKTLTPGSMAGGSPLPTIKPLAQRGQTSLQQPQQQSQQQGQPQGQQGTQQPSQGGWDMTKGWYGGFYARQAAMALNPNSPDAVRRQLPASKTAMYLYPFSKEAAGWRLPRITPGGRIDRTADLLGSFGRGITNFFSGGTHVPVPRVPIGAPHVPVPPPVTPYVTPPVVPPAPLPATYNAGGTLGGMGAVAGGSVPVPAAIHVPSALLHPDNLMVHGPANRPRMVSSRPYVPPPQALGANQIGHLGYGGGLPPLPSSGGGGGAFGFGNPLNPNYVSPVHQFPGHTSWDIGHGSSTAAPRWLPHNQRFGYGGTTPDLGTAPFANAFGHGVSSPHAASPFQVPQGIPAAAGAAGAVPAAQAGGWWNRLGRGVDWMAGRTPPLSELGTPGVPLTNTSTPRWLAYQAGRLVPNLLDPVTRIPQNVIGGGLDLASRAVGLRGPAANRLGTAWHAAANTALSPLRYATGITPISELARSTLTTGGRPGWGQVLSYAPLAALSGGTTLATLDRLYGSNMQRGLGSVRDYWQGTDTVGQIEESRRLGQEEASRRGITRGPLHDIQENVVNPYHDFTSDPAGATWRQLGRSWRGVGSGLNFLGDTTTNQAVGNNISTPGMTNTEIPDNGGGTGGQPGTTGTSVVSGAPQTPTAPPPSYHQPLRDLESQMSAASDRANNTTLSPVDRRTAAAEVLRLQQQHQQMMTQQSTMQPIAGAMGISAPPMLGKLTPMSQQQLVGLDQHLRTIEPQITTIHQQHAAGQPLTQEQHTLVTGYRDGAMNLAYNRIHQVAGLDPTQFAHDLASYDPRNPATRTGVNNLVGEISGLGASNNPNLPQRVRQVWEGMSRVQQGMMIAGLGLGVAAMFSAFSGGGLGLTSILAILGLGMGGFAGAQSGMFGDRIQAWLSSLTGGRDLQEIPDAPPGSRMVGPPIPGHPITPTIPPGQTGAPAVPPGQTGAPTTPSGPLPPPTIAGFLHAYNSNQPETAFNIAARYFTSSPQGEDQWNRIIAARTPPPGSNTPPATILQIAAQISSETRGAISTADAARLLQHRPAIQRHINLIRNQQGQH